MARQLRIEFPGAFYHVTSRGNEQKDVFKSRKDREKFLDYLESATQRYGAVIHAWCLMNNHYLCGAPHKKCYVKRELM
ncbi:toxin RelE [Desulfuromonas soudanensis]|uniref:Toxin RelE n=1 Tax=Desulfuromonas soudanensis TaxID=1603606 RepID=A0A0M5IR48_9BACT|nr:transposase [Desulfuromonas soudanensis]ALC16218.1 toxin RelE [Desulfuromonas soudanensis]